jgi:hypothetical protein
MSIELIKIACGHVFHDTPARWYIVDRAACPLNNWGSKQVQDLCWGMDDEYMMQSTAALIMLREYRFGDSLGRCCGMDNLSGTFSQW